MTVENCIKLLEIYKSKAEDSSASASVRKQSLKNYENMKSHILKCKKFSDHVIVKELVKLEVDDDGKKSKRFASK